MEQILLFLVVFLVVFASFAVSIVKWLYRYLRDRRHSITAARHEPSADTGQAGLRPLRLAANGLRERDAPAVQPAGSVVNGHFAASGVADSQQSYGHPPSVLPAAVASSGALGRIRSLPPLKQAVLWSEILARPVGDREE